MVEHEDTSSHFATPISRRSMLTTVASAGAGAVGAGLVPEGLSAHAEMKGMSQAVQLNLAMRRLWQEHIVWTRLFIVSFAANLPDLQPTTQRLLRNQTDIGNAIKPFYGNAAGAKLTALLRQHILGAAAVLQAAKAGNSANDARAKTAWYANADEIATFLHEANPKNWALGAMKQMNRSVPHPVGDPLPGKPRRLAIPRRQVPGCHVSPSQKLTTPLKTPTGRSDRASARSAGGQARPC